MGIGSCPETGTCILARLCNAEIASKLFLKQSVAVAVVIKPPHTPQLQPGLGVSFRVELHQLDPVGGDKGKEGNKMILGHGVADGNKMLILHRFCGDAVVTVRIFRLQRGQGDAAAADDGVAGAVDDIAAEGADWRRCSG